MYANGTVVNVVTCYTLLYNLVFDNIDYILHYLGKCRAKLSHVCEIPFDSLYLCVTVMGKSSHCQQHVNSV